MDRLEQIKNEVIQEEGIYRDWESYMDDQPYGASDYMVNEVARRYATEVARHNLERAAELATTFADVGGYVHIEKQSITDIDLDLR